MRSLLIDRADGAAGAPDRTSAERSLIGLIRARAGVRFGGVAGAIGARETFWPAGGLSALAGMVGLLVLGWRRDGAARDVGPAAGTIGSP